MIGFVQKLLLNFQTSTCQSLIQETFSSIKPPNSPSWDYPTCWIQDAHKEVKWLKYNSLVRFVSIGINFNRSIYTLLKINTLISKKQSRYHKVCHVFISLQSRCKICIQRSRSAPRYLLFTFYAYFSLTPPSEGLGYQINWVDIKYSCPQTTKWQMLTKIENV